MNEGVAAYTGLTPSSVTFDGLIAQLNSNKGGNVFFVEIGAMDGVRHDALHQHIAAHPQWRGVLVEPLPDMFDKLQASYAGYKNLAFENAAITEDDGTAEITRIPSEKVSVTVPEWADGISTLRPQQHIITQDTGLAQYATKQEVRTMSFASLVEKHKISQIDLFQSDTEGYDKDIFDQMWQMGFRPSVIRLEINYMLLHAVRSLQAQLTSEGYVCFCEGDDIVAARL